MSKIEKQINDLAAWFLEQIQENPFGEIGASVTTHDGQIRIISKTTTTKQQPEKAE
jgi:hypothetical protein